MQITTPDALSIEGAFALDPSMTTTITPTTGFEMVMSATLKTIAPGLTKVLAEITGANTTAFMHGPRGIHAREDNAGTWTHYLQDGLGSVRLYLRARYYDPATGVFTALDPFEGTMQRPMSMNGYSWVGGNTSALSVANPQP